MSSQLSVGRTRLVPALLLVVTAGAAGCRQEAPPSDASDPSASRSETATATVEYVIDGDTIDVVINGAEERVRFTGIDTPEVARAASGSRPASAGECFGDEATAFTEALLPVGTEVRLVRDIVGRDDYGRILAYVYRADDGIFVNYEIVRQGYAQPLTIPPNVVFSDLMVEAARDAEADEAGLWAACG